MRNRPEPPSDTGREGSIIARVGLEDAPWGARWPGPSLCSGAQRRLLGPLRTAETVPRLGRQRRRKHDKDA